MVHAGFMEFISKMAFRHVNASRRPFAPWAELSQAPMSLGGGDGIVVQGRQVCGARERGDEWRNVH